MNDVDLSTYCPLAFGGFDSSTQSVCCNIPPADTNNTFSSFTKIVTSPKIKKIQANLIAGIKDPSCNTCWFFEKNNLNSSLRLSLPRRTQEQAKYEITNLKIKRLVIDSGIVCNLACRTCGPWNSASWWKETRIKERITKYKITEQYFRNTKIDELCLEDYSELQQIMIYGGEPFLNLDHVKVLNKIIEDGNSRHCTLSYTSNMTVDIPKIIILAAEKFKSWDIMMSVDGVKERFEYIRTKGKWNSILSNIDKLQNYNSSNNCFSFGINTVVSALNILYLNEVEKLGKDLDCIMCYQFCRYPQYYDASIFTEGEKSKIIDILKTQNLSKFSSIVDYLNSYKFNKYNRNEFFQEIQFTKDYHNLDAWQYLPELMQLMEEKI